MDRISGLPDEMIRLIVRFLAAKEAACVLVLSKRFKNLYTVVADLEFDDSVGFQGTFTDFVSGALALLEDTTFVRKFSLKSERVLDPASVNHWLRDVLQRSVMDIELCINGDNVYSLPSEIFTCETVVKLKLGRGFIISALPPNALLPALETLFLEDVRFYALDDCAFEAFLLACPVLKELTVDGMYWETWKWSRILSSQSLQRLSIVRELSIGFDQPEPQSISFNTPSLAYLDYSDYVPDEYSIVNFDSLEEAKLNLVVMVNRQWHAIFANDGDLFSSNPTNLIRGIRNVKILELLSPYTFEVFYFFRDAIPVFENLQHLILTHDDSGFCWRCLPYLLNKTPNLKTLVIEGGLHYVEGPGPDFVCNCVLGYSCLLSCRVEVLEIDLRDDGTIGELQQVKHFLGKLPCLKLLKVNTSRRISHRDKLRIIAKLTMLPKALSKCTFLFNWFIPT